MAPPSYPETDCAIETAMNPTMTIGSRLGPKAEAQTIMNVPVLGVVVRIPSGRKVRQRYTAERSVGTSRDSIG